MTIVEPTRRSAIGTLLIATALAAAVLIQAAAIRRHASPTYDEVIYLNLGLKAYRDRDPAVFIRPMVPPLPIWLGAAWPAMVAGRSEVAPERLPDLINRARVAMSAAIGVPLVLVVFAWLKRRRGLAAGALGGALLAFSPSVIAHASLATTDAAFTLFSLVALAALVWYRARPTSGRFLVVGAAIGTALAAKQSAIFLFPVALVWLAEIEWERRNGARAWPRTSGRVVLKLVGLAALAFLVDWAWYGFAVGPLLGPGIAHETAPRFFGAGPRGAWLQHVAETVPVPASINTTLMQIGHGLRGHPAFLMGERSDHGFRLYFPLAILVKSTAAELLLAVIGLVLFVRDRAWRDPVARLWALSFVTIGGLAVLSTINIGHRYVLVLYPLMVLLAVDRLGVVARRSSRRFAAGAAVLVLLQVGAASTISPHYLAYFNRLAGGPSEGYRYLVDSSLDWGQDLPSLKATLDRLGGGRATISYFGSVPPSVYGIDAVPWGDDRELNSTRWLVVSATHLQGVYLSGDPFAALRHLKPTARAGYGLFVYDLRDPAVREALHLAQDD